MKRKTKKPAQRAAKRTTSRKSAQKPASKPKAAHTKSASAKKTQSAPRDALDALVAAGAKLLGLPLDPAWHGGVKFNLQLILRHAALVEEFSLPDDAEPAPVYYA